MKKTIILLVIFLVLGTSLMYGDYRLISEFDRIKSLAQNPNESLKNLGELVTLGNASLDQSRIIFLPEIHDNEDSLLTQLLLLAYEKKRRGSIFVLDESLSSLKKSPWELFSQKTMEILAARVSNQNRESYVPKNFERKLHNISKALQREPGDLEYVPTDGIWAVRSFLDLASPFYGWDADRKMSLTKRNHHMVDTLKKALAKYDRVYVMVGARHVPDLELITSQQVLCDRNIASSLAGYFSYIKRRFGHSPEINMSIGSTLPIYEFIKNQKYSIIFTDKFFKDLKTVMKDFHKNDFKGQCLKI